MRPANVQIIQTKLVPSRITGQPQRRERLLASLNEQKDKRLTLITGPAGCGKTTFSVLWRTELVKSSRAVCWYDLAPEDADVAQFVTYLVESFKNVDPAFGDSALNVFNQSGGRPIDAFLGALVADLIKIGRPVHLFLEDFHFVANSKVVGLVEKLIELAPPTLKFIITSRSRPQLNLLKLRVRDEIFEIGFPELRFTLPESISFLRNQKVSGLSVAQMHRLYLISDGWAAGLQLLAYSMKKSKDPAAYINHLQRSLSAEKEDSLTQYLEESLSSTLSEDEMDFLVKTSACRRFNAELCALVTGRDKANAAQILERFENDNLFVIPIDFADERQWYRFHKTFSRFLNERLLRLSHVELRQINRTASEWFAEKGLRVEAIRHAMYAGDIERCVALVEENARMMFGTGQTIQLLKWFDQLPREWTRERLELLLCVAWAQVSIEQPAELEWTLSAIHALPDSAPSGVQFELQLLQAHRMLKRDDTGAALQLLEPYLDSTPLAGRFVQHALNLLSSLALVYADDFERVRNIARRSREQVFGYMQSTHLPYLDGAVALSYLLQGDVRQARDLLSESLRRGRNRDNFGPGTAAYLAGYYAEACYQLDELGEADLILAENAELIALLGTADSILFAYRVETRLLLARGDIEAAFAVTCKVQEFGTRHQLERLISWSLREQVHIQILRKRIPAATECLSRLEQLANTNRGHLNCAFSEIPLLYNAAQVDLMMAQGNFAKAKEVLTALLGQYQARGHMLRVAFLLIRSAGADVALAEAELALDDMRRALSIATKYGLVRIFVDNAAVSSPLLVKLVQENVLSGDEAVFAKMILDRLAMVPPRAAALASGRQGSSKECAVNLSARELEIVELLAKAFSTKSIGRTLNVSPGTIKWHLKNIYSKLDAVSRENAVVKARNHGLID